MKNSYLEKIKSLRTEKGISQKEIADKLGFGQSNYNKIENGLTELNVSKLFEIAEILGVSVSTILGYDEVEKLKIEIEKRDKLIGLMTIFAMEFANGVNTEDNNNRLKELTESIKEKYQKINDL